jgi:hypothetical protein
MQRNYQLVYGGDAADKKAETVEETRHAFQRTPNKAIFQASRELQVFAYEVQIVQELKPENSHRQNFATDMLHRIDVDPDFLPGILFPCEATFPQSRKASRHNGRIWGSENPHNNRQLV